MSDGAEYEILFKTRAELQGARQLSEELQRQIGKLKALGQDASEVEAKLRRVNAAIAGAGKPSGPGMAEMFGKVREHLGEVVPGFAKLDGLMSKFAGGAIGAVAGGFTLLAGALAAAKHSLAEYAEAEEHVAKLDAALAQAGELTDSYREKLQDLAQEMQEATAIADDQWLAALTRLTQFGAKPENIEEYISTVKDLAGLLNGDVQQAAVVVARAIQGDYQQLARMGIHIDETKSKLEQWKQVAQEAAARGGGQLEAAGKTLNGNWKELGLTIADLSKGVGRWISSTGIVQGTLRLLSDGFGHWAEKISGVVPRLEGLKNSTRPTIQTLAEAAASSSSFAKALEEDAKQAKAAADALNGYIARLKDVQRLQDELEDAQMAEELAVVEDSDASGSEKAKKKGAIRQNYAQKKFDRQQETIKREIKAREDAFAKAGGEVLEYDRAIEDTKQQRDYQQEIENTQRVLRVQVGKTAEARKKNQEAILKYGVYRKPLEGLPQLGTNGETLKTEDSAHAQGLFGSENYRAKVEAAQREYDDAQRAEQKLREQLRALKGAPGLTSKSAAELQAELERLKGKRDQAFGRLGDAEQGLGANEGLRNQFRFNERTYKARIGAAEITTGTEVRREQQKEAEQKAREEKKQLEEQLQGARYGFPSANTAPVENALKRNHGAIKGVFESIVTTIEGQTTDINGLARRVKLLEQREDVRDRYQF